MGRNLVVISFGKLIVGLNKQRARRILEIRLKPKNYHTQHKIWKDYKMLSGSIKTSWKILLDLQE